MTENFFTSKDEKLRNHSIVALVQISQTELVTILKKSEHFNVRHLLAMFHYFIMLDTLQFFSVGMILFENFYEQFKSLKIKITSEEVNNVLSMMKHFQMMAPDSVGYFIIETLRNNPSLYNPGKEWFNQFKMMLMDQSITPPWINETCSIIVEILEENPKFMLFFQKDIPLLMRMFQLGKSYETTSQINRLLVRIVPGVLHQIPMKFKEDYFDIVFKHVENINQLKEPLILQHASIIRHVAYIMIVIELWDKVLVENVFITYIQIYFKINPNIRSNVSALFVSALQNSKKSKDFIDKLNQNNGMLFLRFFAELKKDIQENIEDCGNNANALIIMMGTAMGVVKEKFNLENKVTAYDSNFQSHFKQETKKRNILKLCDYCGKENATQKCSACGNAFYCDRSCQVEDWKIKHKGLCKKK
jgi:hypothetical protein